MTPTLSIFNRSVFQICHFFREGCAFMWKTRHLMKSIFWGLKIVFFSGHHFSTISYFVKINSKKNSIKFSLKTSNNPIWTGNYRILNGNQASALSVRLDTNYERILAMWTSVCHEISGSDMILIPIQTPIWWK